MYLHTNPPILMDVDREFAIVSPERLQNLIAQTVRNALDEALPSVLREARQPPYLNKRQLSEQTGWSIRKIGYLMSEGRLPFIRRGRSVLFRTEDIRKWLHEGYVPTRTNGHK